MGTAAGGHRWEAALDEILNPENWQRWLDQGVTWLRQDVLVWASLAQFIAVGATFAVAWLIAPPMARATGRLRDRLSLGGWVERGLAELEEQMLPVTWLAVVWMVFAGASGARLSNNLLEIAVSLLVAWVLIQFASTLIRTPGTRRAFAVVAWTGAALNILDLLDPLIELLDSIAIDIGGFHLSVTVVIRGLLLFAVLLWAALLASRTLERRLGASEALSPSVKVLFGQLTKIILITLAVVVSLSSMGVDLTAFAVFTGALGVGIGFGLQKVVSNLFAGVLLLTDRSIKPGDVIAVGDKYGWINFMGARYVSVITRDGTEHLIPNEHLITTTVENWSYSNNLLRLRIPIGISYKSDPHKAIALVLEAAGEVERVLKEPKTVCLLKGFGDSSVDLEARIWINDPRNGISNVKSEVLLLVWDKFHAAGIEIPFPQRDLHIKSNEAGLATRVS